MTAWSVSQVACSQASFLRYRSACLCPFAPAAGAADASTESRCSGLVARLLSSSQWTTSLLDTVSVLSRLSTWVTTCTPSPNRPADEYKPTPPCTSRATPSAVNPAADADLPDLRRVADAACTGVGAVTRLTLNLLRVLLPSQDATHGYHHPHAPPMPSPRATGSPGGGAFASPPGLAATVAAAAATAAAAVTAGAGPRVGGAATSPLRFSSGPPHSLPDALLDDDLSPVSTVVASPSSSVASPAQQARGGRASAGFAGFAGGVAPTIGSPPTRRRLSTASVGTFGSVTTRDAAAVEDLCVAVMGVVLPFVHDHHMATLQTQHQQAHAVQQSQQQQQQHSGSVGAAFCGEVVVGLTDAGRLEGASATARHHFCPPPGGEEDTFLTEVGTRSQSQS